MKISEVNDIVEGKNGVTHRTSVVQDIMESSNANDWVELTAEEQQNINNGSTTLIEVLENHFGVLD